MKTIFGEVVHDFVVKNLDDCQRGFGPSKAIGFADDTGLKAGVVYHNWSPETQVIELSAASTTRKWLTKDALRQIFAYPFDQLGCRLCVARISENNTRTRRIWRALGATEHIIPAMRGPREAEIISILSAETWADGKFSKG